MIAAALKRPAMVGHLAANTFNRWLASVVRGLIAEIARMAFELGRLERYFAALESQSGVPGQRRRRSR